MVDLKPLNEATEKFLREEAEMDARRLMEHAKHSAGTCDECLTRLLYNMNRGNTNRRESKK